MRSEKEKINVNGISLIILVITIIIIIILAGAVILSLNSTNIIAKSKEATFKTNISSIKEELDLYLSANIQEDGSYIYPVKSDIKSADKYSEDVLNIVNRKVIYKTSDANEKTWAESLGIVVDYTNGLVANYKMNGNALDSSGSNNGTIYGGLTTVKDRLGKINGAYSFNGTNSYIMVPYTPTLAPITQVTCSAWVYRADWSTLIGDTRLLSKTENGGWDILFDNPLSGTGYAGFIVNRAGTAGYICSKFLYTELSSGWHHFVGTYDGRYTSIYIDGVLESTVDSVTNLGIGYSCNNSLIIGAEAGGADLPAGQYFNGFIDDVRVYSRALSEGEVKSLYEVYWGN